MIEDQPHAEDLLRAQRCLEGDHEAMAEMQQQFRSDLVSFLTHSNIPADHARELIAELWGDILKPREGRNPRLATYVGNSSLLTWLKAVVLNKYLQSKRKEEPPSRPLPGPDDPDELPAPDAPPVTEAPLLAIMRCAVQAGLAGCEPDKLLMLKFASAHGLYGRELGRLFGCSESTISRDLGEVKKQIRKATLEYVRAQDGHLELQWEDFLALCGALGPGFFAVE